MAHTKQYTFSKKELADFNNVSRIYRKLDGAVVATSYELGRAVNTTMEHAKVDREMYDKQVIEHFAAELDCNVAALYGAARVYRAWPTKMGFRALADLEHEDGWKLKWTHFAYLSGTGIANYRERLAQQAFKGKWSTVKLQQVVRKKTANTRDPRGRKGNLIPKSIDDCLKHMAAQASRIVTLADTNWFGDKFNIITRLQEKPIDTLNNSLVNEMNDAISEMRSVSSSFITYADDLERLADELVTKMEAKAPATLHPGEQETDTTPTVTKPRRRRATGKTGPQRPSRPGV